MRFVMRKKMKVLVFIIIIVQESLMAEGNVDKWSLVPPENVTFFT
jgi:hypothetical protein